MDRVVPEQTFVEAENVLAARGRAASAFSSPTGIGRAREDAFSEELARHLPSRLLVVRGELADGTGARSGEVDVIVVDGNRGTRQAGGDVLVTVEAAVAGIEVKSTLVGRDLEGAVRKIARIKQLVRGGGTGITRGSSGMTPRIPIPPRRTAGFIFSYGGPGWGTIKRRLAENPEWYASDFMLYGPDVIAVVGNGVVVKNDLHVLAPPPGAEDLALLQDTTLPGIQVCVSYAQELLDRYGDLTYPQYTV